MNEWLKVLLVPLFLGLISCSEKNKSIQDFGVKPENSPITQ